MDPVEPPASIWRMESTRSVAVLRTRGSAAGALDPSAREPAGAPGDRGQRTLARLAELQALLDGLDADLADARRECAQLQAENRRLTAELGSMRRRRKERVSRAMLRGTAHA